MFCHNCGNKLPEDAAFCSSCGAKIQASASNVCTACGAAIPDGAEFCINCGKAANRATPEQMESHHVATPAPPQSGLGLVGFQIGL